MVDIGVGKKTFEGRFINEYDEACIRECHKGLILGHVIADSIDDDLVKMLLEISVLAARKKYSLMEVIFPIS